MFKLCLWGTTLKWCHGWDPILVLLASSKYFSFSDPLLNSSIAWDLVVQNLSGWSLFSPLILLCLRQAYFIIVLVRSILKCTNHINSSGGYHLLNWIAKTKSVLPELNTAVASWMSFVTKSWSSIATCPHDALYILILTPLELIFCTVVVTLYLRLVD
jgi:hypothetical protein